MNREEINELSNRIIGLALEVHKALGPGFVEKIYQKAWLMNSRRQRLLLKNKKE